MYRSVETSCRIRSIGNSGARSSGPTGWWVPGCSGGGGGAGRSGMMLYQLVGISRLVEQVLVLPDGHGCAAFAVEARPDCEATRARLLHSGEAEEPVNLADRALRDTVRRRSDDSARSGLTTSARNQEDRPARVGSGQLQSERHIRGHFIRVGVVDPRGERPAC